MRRDDDERLTAWMNDTRAEGFERRDWRRVQKLAALCVTLMATGLLVGLWPAAAGVAVVCHVAAGVFGGLMLACYRDDRLFVPRPPAH